MIQFKVEQNPISMTVKRVAVVGEGGFERGYEAGYAKGNTDGYTKGHADGYNQGYDEGTASGTVDYLDLLNNDTLEEYSNATAKLVRQYLFYNNINIKKVDFPMAVKIDSSAFLGCKALTELNFPNVKTLGSNAFRQCSKLNSVYFPNVTEVGGSAFYQCGAHGTVIDLPKVTTIGSMAFWASSVKTLIIRSSTVCSLSNSNAFKGTNLETGGTGFIYVPDDLVDSYKAATNWSTYATQIKPLSELEV